MGDTAPVAGRVVEMDLATAVETAAAAMVGWEAAAAEALVAAMESRW